MTRMTGPDCVVMCNLINTYIHTYIHTSVFLFRCVASVALALVFMPGLYSAAYRAASLA